MSVWFFIGWNLSIRCLYTMCTTKACFRILSNICLLPFLMMRTSKVNLLTSAPNSRFLLFVTFKWRCCCCCYWLWWCDLFSAFLLLLLLSLLLLFLTPFVWLLTPFVWLLIFWLMALLEGNVSGWIFGVRDSPYIFTRLSAPCGPGLLDTQRS